MDAQQITVGGIEAHGNPNGQLDGPGATMSAAPDMAAGARAVLIVPPAAQFLMSLDSPVMNVSVVYVANDLGTTVTRVQTAITLCTLMMASLMITGSRIGALIGRRRAFTIGCCNYAAASFVTAVARNLETLPIGRSVAVGDFLHTVLNEVPGWASTIAAHATAA